jgi:hypothetical protein
MGQEASFSCPRSCHRFCAWILTESVRGSRFRLQCPRRESDLRHRFRKPVLYPLSYEGNEGRAS